MHIIWVTWWKISAQEEADSKLSLKFIIFLSHTVPVPASSFSEWSQLGKKEIPNKSLVLILPAYHSHLLTSSNLIWNIRLEGKLVMNKGFYQEKTIDSWGQTTAVWAKMMVDLVLSGTACLLYKGKLLPMQLKENSVSL